MHSRCHIQHLSLESQRCTNFMCLMSFGTNTFKAYPAIKALLQLASPASTGHYGLRNWTPHGWLKMRLELTYIFVIPDQGVTERRRHCASSIIQKRSLGASCRQPRPSHIARDSLESSVNSIAGEFYHVKDTRIPLSHEFKIRIWTLNRTSHKIH